MTVGQNIRAYRKKRGLTQAGLGALCGVHGATIGVYESGGSLPRRRVAEKIAAALDVPVEKLLDGGGEVPAAGGGPLYDGVLAALRDLYGAVEGRVVLDGSGGARRYYVVSGGADSFVLYEADIAAIAGSVGATLPPLLEYLRKTRTDGEG